MQWVAQAISGDAPTIATDFRDLPTERHAFSLRASPSGRPNDLGKLLLSSHSIGRPHPSSPPLGGGALNRATSSDQRRLVHSL